MCDDDIVGAVAGGLPGGRLIELETGRALVLRLRQSQVARIWLRGLRELDGIGMPGVDHGGIDDAHHVGWISDIEYFQITAAKTRHGKLERTSCRDTEKQGIIRGHVGTPVDNLNPVDKGL